MESVLLEVPDGGLKKKKKALYYLWPRFLGTSCQDQNINPDVLAKFKVG
jgi:hypothetical protein